MFEKKYHVLLVESDHSIAETMTHLFESYEIDLTVVETCGAAHKAIENLHIDAAVLDYYLSAQEACKELAKKLRGEGVPCLLITGYFKPEQINEVIQCDLWLAKPFGIEELLSALGKLIDLHNNNKIHKIS